jgi:cell division protease FtsH
MIPAKPAFYWLVIVVCAVLLWQVAKSSHPSHAAPEISYSEFLTGVASGQVSKVVISGSVVQGTEARGGNFRVIAPSDQAAMLQSLREHAVEIRFRETSDQGWPSMMLNLFPVIVLAFLWCYLVREKQKRRMAEKGSPNAAPPQEQKPRFGP